MVRLQRTGTHPVPTSRRVVPVMPAIAATAATANHAARGGDRSQTCAAPRAVIPALQSRGLRFVALGGPL